MEIAPWGNIHTIDEDGQETDLNAKVLKNGKKCFGPLCHSEVAKNKQK